MFPYNSRINAYAGFKMSDSNDFLEQIRDSLTIPDELDDFQKEQVTKEQAALQKAFHRKRLSAMTELFENRYDEVVDTYLNDDKVLSNYMVQLKKEKLIKGKKVGHTP